MLMTTRGLQALPLIAVVGLIIVADTAVAHLAGSPVTPGKRSPRPWTKKGRRVDTMRLPASGHGMISAFLVTLSVIAPSVLRAEEPLPRNSSLT